MNINEKLFMKVYQECMHIIEDSPDGSIQSKKSKLQHAFETSINHQDAEIQGFYSIVAELRTYQFLKNNSFTIKVQDDEIIGPDFFVPDIGYIECVSVTKGQPGYYGRQYVDDVLSGQVNRYIASLPRMSSVILDKKEKYTRYFDKNVIDQKMPRLIAVNASIFANEFHGSLVFDSAMKILYGIGCQTIRISKNNSLGECSDMRTYMSDNTGKKSDSTLLQLDYFSQEPYRIVSAVIVENNPIGEPLAKDQFCIFINPNAIAPIDTKCLKDLVYFAQENIDGHYVQYQWHNTNLPLTF